MQLNKDEPIRFGGQKVKGQGHSLTPYGQISTLEGISQEHIYQF